MNDLNWDQLGWPAKKTAVRKTRARRMLTNQQKAWQAMMALKKARYGAKR